MTRNIGSAALTLLCGLTSISCAAQVAAPPQMAAPAKQAELTQSSATYRVGLKSILVPPPADLRETGPDYRVLFEHDAPDSNRLVAAYIPDADIARLPAKPEDGLVHYALLETLRQAEFTDIDDALFKQVTAAVAQQFGTTADTPAMDVKAFQDELNHKLKAEGSKSEVSMDKPVPLGTFFAKANASGFGMVINVAGGGKTKKVIIGVGLIKVQKRLIYASVYALYTGDDSATWVRTVSEQWADAILKANP